MQKIDRRRHYIMVMDTETANTIVTQGGKLDMRDVLVYDCGWQVTDTHGNVYSESSFVNRDIFMYEQELMAHAYYANKIPQYYKELAEGSRKECSTYELKKFMLADIEKYRIKEVAAHNAHFDVRALNNTRRYVTKSLYRYWFPREIIIWDTLKMARDAIAIQPTYRRFCEKQGYKKPKLTAEMLYRYISGNPDFTESHTGLEDVNIERQILAYCYRQHKKMRKEAYTNKKPYYPMTEVQRRIWESL